VAVIGLQKNARPIVAPSTPFNESKRLARLEAVNRLLNAVVIPCSGK
jgi:hypothetical protein